MNLTGWRFWALAALLVAGWVGLGYLFDTSATAVSWLAKVAVVGQPAAVIAFVTVYTLLGIKGAAKWWLTDIGNRIVLFPLAVVLSSCVLVWAIFFRHGAITGPLSAWIYIGGYLGSDFLMIWGTWLWVRAFRDSNEKGPAS